MKYIAMIIMNTLIAQAAQAQTTPPTTPALKKERAVAVLKSLETGDRKPFENYVSADQYIQHNLAFPNGQEVLLGALDQLKAGGAKVDTRRVLADGDYVALHSEYNLFGNKTGFDIFRFENGKIVEHWDNLQPKADKNPSGHTMTDGPTDIKDENKTEANKTLVREFIQTILVDGKMEKLAGFFDGDNYVQHNPQIADGVSGLGKALEALSKQGITMKYDKTHLVVGEGNFVLAVSEGTFGGKATCFYDLWRVESGKIAEHWDVMETIPARSEWKNSNGKF
jgi:predicted SnoaL-like aldol condensation-catalyzing enzyme